MADTVRKLEPWLRWSSILVGLTLAWADIKSNVAVNTRTLIEMERRLGAVQERLEKHHEDIIVLKHEMEHLKGSSAVRKIQ